MSNDAINGGNPAAPPPVDREHRRLAVLSGVASYLDSGVIVSSGVALALWKSQFHIGDWAIGALSAALTFAIAVGSILGGRIADRFGRRRVYNWDVLLYTVGALLVATAPNSTMLFAGLILAGLAGGADLPASLAMISEHSPRAVRGRLIGFTQTMWMLGIVGATLVGFATSALGSLSPRILFLHLAVVAFAGWILRGRLHVEPVHDEVDAAVQANAERQAGGVRYGMRLVLAKPVLIPLLATGGYYVAWNLAANTIGQYGAYFLTTVSGASQTLATGLNLACLPLGVLGSLVYVKAADAGWRDRLFRIGAGLQVLAFVLAAVTGGGVMAAMVLFLLLYNVVNQFAGEGQYKVWSQEAFPETVRGTAQGVTTGVSRGLCGVFGLVTPTLMSIGGSLILWLCVAFMAVSGLLGALLVIRRIAPAPAPSGRAPAEIPAPAPVG